MVCCQCGTGTIRMKVKWKQTENKLFRVMIENWFHHFTTYYHHRLLMDWLIIFSMLFLGNAFFSQFKSS